MKGSCRPRSAPHSRRSREGAMLVRDLAFYNVGCEPQPGPRRLVVLMRRALRRVLRPIFQRQVEILTSLCDRLDAAEHQTACLRKNQEELSEQLQTTLAFGWDYVALVRRLAVLEDRVESLMEQSVAPHSGHDSTPHSIRLV